MNEHLKLVRDFHETFPYSKVQSRVNCALSDMDIVKHQALLMEAGGDVLNAINAGEIVEILLGLVDLAYSASIAIAMQGGDITDTPISWRHDGSVLSIMKILGDKINNCTLGGSGNYSELYCLCNYLTRNFINADFDKAFRMIHNSYMERLKESGQSIYDSAESCRKAKLKNSPDLSDCLFE